MSETRPRQYFETLENGLTKATDVILENSSDMDEVKKLMFGRYRHEDERRAACNVQRGEMYAQLASMAHSTARYHEPRPPQASGDQLRRLAEEMRDQRQETVELVMQFVDECRSIQGSHHYQVMTALENLRSETRPRRR